MLELTSLSDLKRAVAVPGALVKVLRNDVWAGRPELLDRLRKAAEGRRVAKVQKNAIKLDDNSWVYWGKAAAWDFPGDDTAIWRPTEDARLIIFRVVPPEVAAA